MPSFELTTNVKEVPAEFHKETTNLIAELLGKPSSVSDTFPAGSKFVKCNVCRQLAQLMSPSVTFTVVIWVIRSAA